MGLTRGRVAQITPEGFELGKFSSQLLNQDSNVYCAVKTTSARSGRWGMEVNKASTGSAQSGFYIWNLPGGEGGRSYIIAINVETLPSSGVTVRVVGIKSVAAWGVKNDSGTLKFELFDGNGTSLFVGAGRSTGTWYFMTLRIYDNGNTNGIDIPGSTKWQIFGEIRNTSGSVLDTSGVQNGTSPFATSGDGIFLGVIAATTSAIKCHLDDGFYLGSGATAPNSHTIISPLPTANGTDNAWTLQVGPNKWNDVDDHNTVAPNDDTDYIKSTGLSQNQTFTHPATGISGSDQVFSIKATARLRAVAGAPALCPRLRLSQIWNPLVVLSTTYSDQPIAIVRNDTVAVPDYLIATGEGQLGVSDADNVQFGAGRFASSPNEARCTVCVLEVSYGVEGSDCVDIAKAPPVTPATFDMNIAQFADSVVGY